MRSARRLGEAVCMGAHWTIVAARESVILAAESPTVLPGVSMRLRLLAPRYWLTWVGLGLLRLLAFLPFGAMLRLGRWLGWVLRHLPLGFVQTARRNIELCLPELSGAEREHLLKEHFASLGIALLE